MLRPTLTAIAFTLLSGCYVATPPEAEPDAGVHQVDAARTTNDGGRADAISPSDAARDRPDAGTDAAQPDGGPDAAPPDAGPPCECSFGPCCDGCFFRSAAHRCGAEEIYGTECRDPSAACPGYHIRIREQVGARHCAGDSAACDGEIVHVLTRYRQCWTVEAHEFCIVDAAGDRCGTVAACP